MEVPTWRDIERALAGDWGDDNRDLQQEAVAYYRVQERIDAEAARGDLTDPAAPDFLRQLHRDFYDKASPEMLTIRVGDLHFVMMPGEWRQGPEQDAEIGRHLPPQAIGCRPSWTISISALPSSRNPDA